MLFVVIGGAGILLVTYLALDYVFTQYRHTKRSRTVLLAEAMVCLLLAVFLASRLTGMEVLFRVAVGLAMGLLMYSALAVVTVETWRRMAVSDGGQGAAGSMQLRMQRLQEEYEAVVREINELNRKKKALEREHDEELFRQRKLENEVHRWQGGAGMERIRSLRVEDWTRELSNLSESQLESMREEFQRKVSEADAEREEALRVRAALAELQLLRRRMDAPNRALSEIKRALDEAEGRKGSLALEIQEMDRELRTWSHRGEDDSEDRIELR